MAFLPPPVSPLKLHLLLGKLGHFFLPLWRPACSAPSAPIYTSVALHLGPVWSAVAPRRWGKNVPSTLNPVVSVSHSSSLIWNPSCSGCWWQTEKTPSPCLLSLQNGSCESRVLPPVRRQESISFTSVVQEFAKSSLIFQVICECWQGWRLLGSSWSVRLLHSSLLQTWMFSCRHNEHLWWWRGRITWINRSE